MNVSRAIRFLAMGATTATLMGPAGVALAERVQVGANLVSTFGVGEVTDYASPSVGGTATARFVASRWLAVGIVGGIRRNTMAATDETSANPKTELTLGMAGLSAHFALAELTEGTHPFLGIDGGYAQFTADHRTFAAQPAKSSTTGFFVTPQVGIETRIGHRLSFEVSARYDYVRAKEALEIGDTHARDLSGAGLAAGFSFGL
jgi:hypothetical protein